MLAYKTWLVKLSYLAYYICLTTAEDIELFATDYSESKVPDDGIHFRNTTACLSGGSGGYLASTAETRGYRYSYNATRAVLYFLMAPDGALVQIRLDDKIAGNRSTFNSAASVETCDMMMFDTGTVSLFSSVSIVHNGKDSASKGQNSTMRLYKAIISSVDTSKTEGNSTLSPSASQTAQGSQDRQAVPIQAIVGGTVGAVLGLAIICGGIFFLYKRRGQKRKSVSLPAQLYYTAPQSTYKESGHIDPYITPPEPIRPISQQNSANQLFPFVTPAVQSEQDPDTSFGDFNPYQTQAHPVIAPAPHNHGQINPYAHAPSDSLRITSFGTFNSTRDQKNERR